MPLLRELPEIEVVAVDSSRAVLRVLVRKLSKAEAQRCGTWELPAEKLDSIDCDASRASVMMALFDMDDHVRALKNIASVGQAARSS